VSSMPVVLISSAQLALAQLTNFALFDEKGNLAVDEIEINALSPVGDFGLWFAIVWFVPGQNVGTIECSLGEYFLAGFSDSGFQSQC